MGKLSQISGHARPTARMRNMALAVHGPKFAESIGSMLESAVAVNALAEMLDKAFEAGLMKNGSIDLKESAMCLINLMRDNQK